MRWMLCVSLCAACAASPTTPAVSAAEAAAAESEPSPAAADPARWSAAIEAEAVALKAAHPGAEVRIVVLDAAESTLLAAYGEVTAPTPTGSTMKPLTVYAALVEGLDPRLQIDASAPLQIEGTTIEDARNNGVLTLSEALAKSSNIAVAKVVLSVGWERLYAAVGAMVPLPDGAGSTMLEAIGQLDGFTTQVPLQTLVAAYAAMDDDSDEGAAVLEMLRLAVTDEGTGERAAVRGIGVLGKTGTAQGPAGQTAVFVGRARGERDEVWVGVNVRGVGKDAYGGSVAAPAFAHIIEAALMKPEAEPTR